MSGAGFVSVPVVPTFKGMSKEFAERLEKPAKLAGERAGKSISEGVGSGVQNLEKQMKASSGKVEKFSKDAEKAKDRLTVAEKKHGDALEASKNRQKDYNEAVAKYGEDSAQARKAKERWNDAETKAVDLGTKRKNAEADVEAALKKRDDQQKDLNDTTEKYEQAQDDLAKSLGMTRDELDQLEGEFAGLDEAMAQSAEQARGFGGKMMDGLREVGRGALLGIGAKMGTAIMSGVQSAMAEGWRTALDLDRVSRSLSAMTSSAEVAEQMMGDLREVAGDKPVDYTAFLDAANTLAYMGYEGDEAVRVLDNIATAAVGAGRDGTEALVGAADALGKMQANGKVTQNEISMISERGIPVLDMLIEHFGLTAGSYEELKDMISSGSVELDDVFQALGGTGAESFQMLADSAENMSGSLESQIALLKDDMNVAIGEALQPVLNDLDFEGIAESIGDIAARLMEFLPHLIDLGLWVANNIHWLAPAAGVLAGIAGAIWLVNLAMAANPIVLIAAGIVAAFAAMVAALTWFFTQTELGQEMWAAFTETLGVAWDWVVEKLTAGWDWLRDNVFAPMAAFVTETLWPALESAFTWIGEKWQQLGDGLGVVWNWMRDNVFTPLSDAVTILAAWFQEKLWEIQNYWELFKFALQVTWQWINDNVFAPIERAIQRVALWFQEKLWEINNHWVWLKFQLQRTWLWIDENVFAKIGSGLDTVKGWFEAAVDGIGRIWDGLRAAAARPVRFVVDTVWNKGILRAWNAIADFLPGIDAKEQVPLGELGDYAHGGVLPGYTPGRDPYTFIEPRTGLRIGLSGGEAIMRPEWTRAVGGPSAVERMNQAAKTGKLDEEQIRIGQAHGFLGAFASGGVIGAMMDIVRAKYGNILTMTSGYRPGHGPYHGTGQATDWSNGGGNTPQQLALAHDIAQTYPGSTELIYDSPGWSGNIKHGSNVGAFGQYYTMAQAGPHHHHVHWAMTTPPTMQFGGGVFEGGSSGGGLGAAVVNWVADRARGIWDRMVSPIKGLIDDKLGDWGDSSFAQIPMGMFTSLRDTAWDFLTSLFGRGGGSNAGSVDVSDISGPVVDQVEAVFARHGFTGQQWEDAKWIIQQESNWNPTAVNPSSGAYGLFQFNPMGGNTLGAYLPDRNPDPAVQADAGARYMKDRYGDPTAARRFWEANQWYADGGIIDLSSMLVRDFGGLVPHGAVAINTSGRDEMMLPPGTTALLNQFFAEFPEVAQALVDATTNLENAAHWLEQAASPHTYEGVAARAAVSQVGEIVGMLGLSETANVISTLLSAESDFLDAQASRSARLAAIEEKSLAVESARAALADAKAAEYEDDAARAEAVKAATEDVTKAESDLADARKESVKSLDMTVHSVMPQLHDSLVAASRAAAGAHPALGGLAGQLASAAVLAGPAGISVGLLFEAVKIIITIGKMIWDLFMMFRNRLWDARKATAAAMRAQFEVLADWLGLVRQQQAEVANLQQELVRGLIEMRTASLNLRTAQADRLVAEAEGILRVHEARLELEAEIERGARAAQLRLMGLHEDWDTYLTYQSLVAGGVLDAWSDAAISKLFEYEKARAQAAKAELSSQVALIEAQFAVAESNRQYLRAQQDMIRAQEMLTRMTAEAFGVDLRGATIGSELARVNEEIVRLQEWYSRPFNRVRTLGEAGVSLGADGKWANANREYYAKMDALLEYQAKLLSEEGAPDVTSSDLASYADLISGLAKSGSDAADYIGSPTTGAELAADWFRFQRQLGDIERDLVDLERAEEDFSAEIDLYEATAGLKEAIEGLSYAIDGLGASADAWAEGNEDARGEYLNLARAYAEAAGLFGVSWRMDDEVATPGARDQIRREVTIYMDGDKVYTADEVDRLLAEVTSGTDVRVRSVRSSDLAAARRNGGI